MLPKGPEKQRSRGSVGVPVFLGMMFFQATMTSRGVFVSLEMGYTNGQTVLFLFGAM